MKKTVTVFLLCFLLGITGCNTKAKEEVLAQTTQVVSELGEISFSFNGYWELKSPEELKNMELLDSQYCDLEACHTLTGTSVNIIYDDLAKSEGGILVRTDDYVNAVLENLKNSKEYTCECSEVSMESVQGENYYTFYADVAEVEARQHFYIRRIENTMMVMIVTLYGEDELEEVLGFES